MMRDLRTAQVIIRKIDAEYRKNLSPVKWNDVYRLESEIAEDLKNIHIPTKEEWFGTNTLYKGYEYIHSFAKQVQSGKSLSEKQMVQCKRLALDIKKAAAIKDCY